MGWPSDRICWRVSLCLHRPTANGGLHDVDGDEPTHVVRRGIAVRPRTINFALLQLDVDKNGKGNGTLAPVCKIKFTAGERAEIENYGRSLPAGQMYIYRNSAKLLKRDGWR